jgi:hypothetical protein
MTARSHKVARTTSRGKIGRLFGSVEGDLLVLTEGGARTESRWDRPRKVQLSLRVDAEVVDWLKSKGPGYQTRINRILRWVMIEGKNREKGK